MSFDREVAFNDLRSRWPSSAPPSKASKARAIFDSIVKDKKWWGDLEVAADEELDKRKPTSLVGFLRNYAVSNGIQLLTPASESPNVAVSPGVLGGHFTAVPLVPVEDPAVMAGFDEVWPNWPANENFHEKEAEAVKAWRKTAKVRDVVVMVRTCKFYTDNFNDPVYGMIYPMHLRNFLTRDDHAVLDEWAAKADDGPTPEDRVEFDGVYAWYPDFKTKKHDHRESMVFWRRHVKPEERLDFVCAVKAYRKARKDASDDSTEMAMYTMGFARFVAEWRAHVTHNAIGRALWMAMSAVLKEYSLDPVEWWIRDMGGKLACLAQHGPGGNMRTSTEVVRECLTRLAKERKRTDLDIEALVAGVIKVSYMEACKLPPARVSYLDSVIPREGDSNVPPPPGGMAR